MTVIEAQGVPFFSRQPAPDAGILVIPQCPVQAGIPHGHEAQISLATATCRQTPRPGPGKNRSGWECLKAAPGRSGSLAPRSSRARLGEELKRLRQLLEQTQPDGNKGNGS